MLNPRENIVVIDGQIRTAEIQYISANSRTQGYNITFIDRRNPNKERGPYPYGPRKVLWLTTPVLFDPQHCHFYHNEKQEQPSFIAAFQKGYSKYWYVEYPSGAHKNYFGNEVRIEK